MDLLSTSPSHPSTLLTSRRLHLSPSKPSISAFNSQISIPLRPHSSRTSLRCMRSSSPKSSKTLDFLSPPGNFYDTFKPSCTQTPATAMKGAESDVMGLLLRERIVFLGSDVDDVLSDAIIGQLLLLDAQDPNKDIRLFIISTGGSLSPGSEDGLEQKRGCDDDAATVIFDLRKASHPSEESFLQRNTNQLNGFVD